MFCEVFRYFFKNIRESLVQHEKTITSVIFPSINLKKKFYVGKNYNNAIYVLSDKRQKSVILLKTIFYLLFPQFQF